MILERLFIYYTWKLNVLLQFQQVNKLPVFSMCCITTKQDSKQ